MNAARLIAPLSDCVIEIAEHKGRTALQMIGIILGVASIITTLALLRDAEQQSVRYYEVTGGVNKLTIYTDLTSRAAGTPLKGLTYGDILALEQNVPHADVVAPTVNRRTVVRARGKEEVLTVIGTTASFATLQDLEVAYGRFLTPADQAASVVVLGSSYAKEFFGLEDAVGQKLLIGEKWFVVVGCLERKYLASESGDNDLEWMNRQMFVPLAALPAVRDELLRDRQLSSIVIRIRDAWALPEATERIRRVLRARHGAEDFRIVSRAERLQRANRIRQMYDITFISCSVISLLVGGVIIMNIQLASLSRRIREVGVRKACGASDVQIFLRFLAESLFVAVFGGVVGVPAGYALTFLVRLFTGNLAMITPFMIFVGIVVAAGTGFVFGVYPAARAAVLNPVDALRME
ncbi:MAG TPA: ABC transporter permease [Thermoanaerobaculia bacterium]|nr:ABC transporter permease [Thermoanaerobaculia bacterium]